MGRNQIPQHLIDQLDEDKRIALLTHRNTALIRNQLSAMLALIYATAGFYIVLDWLELDRWLAWPTAIAVAIGATVYSIYQHAADMRRCGIN